MRLEAIAKKVAGLTRNTNFIEVGVGGHRHEVGGHRNKGCRPNKKYALHMRYGVGGHRHEVGGHRKKGCRPNKKYALHMRYGVGGHRHEVGGHRKKGCRPNKQYELHRGRGSSTDCFTRFFQRVFGLDALTIWDCRGGPSDSHRTPGLVAANLLLCISPHGKLSRDRRASCWDYVAHVA